MPTFVSFKDAIHTYNNQYVFIPTNVIKDHSPELLYDDEDEIFQIFITNAQKDEVERLKLLYPSLKFGFCDYLNAYVLLVDHCGTPLRNVSVEVNTEAYAWEWVKDNIEIMK